ncbi:hypothetical protein DKT68_22100 [Micromonospora acroterricola]|uniref:DUF4352 domain-containing protein n=1 Tax=Micromonospora acroterricola TaxID=2202421 RepID=A0A317CWG4_9ACTN|nr:DUF4352 domain-containing protein [Micromonospora acroterricola]PWR06542.1 hypothetical protein DKT68_22100 [Micromonospora acroterricola]
MTHPQPPVGPQDPQQPNPEPPTQPFPATPQPQSAADPTIPQAPVPPNPWSAEGTAPQPPVSGPPVPGVPVSGVSQPGVPGQWTPPPTPQSGVPGQWTPPPTPLSGVPDQWAPPPTPYPGAPQPPYASAPYPTAPGQAWPQPPFSGDAYPAAGGGGYPPPGGPGYPLTMPPPVPAKSSKKTVVVIAVTAAVLTLLCCAGGIVAVVIGANRAANEVTEALPTPGVTRGVGQPPGVTPAPAPSSTDDDTRNMPAGDTLVIDDNGGTTEITVTKFSTATKPCKSYGLKPDEGMYVIADVTVRVTKGTGSVNPLFFQWVAADGTETNAIAGAFSGCGKPMPAGNGLTVGTTRTGSVVFDVADTNGVLEYQHEFETAGSWKP